MRELSLAAGYKAQFTCSGLFSGGKTLEQIERQELTNIYPSYRPVMAGLPDAVIDRDAKTVSVAFADGMPPRIAAWRPHLGCASLPPGASDVSILPEAKVSETREFRRGVWPRGEKVSSKPLPEGVNGAQLSAALKGALDGEFGGVTSAVVVVQDGRLLMERYTEGFGPTTAQRTWSVAKSIGATIIGAGVLDGHVVLDEPAKLSAWSDADPRSAITLENFLHMGSGLGGQTAGNRTDAVYFGGGLVNEHAVANELIAEPGESWRYANNDTMLALLALREGIADDADYLKFPFERVLRPIGMRNTYLETDWEGNFILSSQVWTTARDLARLGQLYVQDGVWNGRRILPEGWAEYVATPAPAQPGCRREPCRGYGAQFWLYEGYPGIPSGTYAALGNRGQIVMIVPARNVVIVRRGYDHRDARFDDAAFTAAVLEALE
ncbi:serine hydrolase [Parvularcula sp. ZS-1/3]|uniref:Serine hydrolase n=2 Tax=Parvularcula mediterranea TaxID=2732508 RepID=A0A7Y3RKS0_9PROT|nr:serine hydrolase [Parvularcula mediterranea]